ncbi:hypothetical protein Q8A67_023616 [Cirrhinus molitorella]|uniref:Uncharacterized protein n=1 Tax=Cirrhinus molitorella TaxID=172907 RepID=A0AA88TL24_9TELE|nr:hypothetical protein Q8A67_023616 [Cirrhinus molitorella]
MIKKGILGLSVHLKQNLSGTWVHTPNGTSIGSTSVLVQRVKVERRRGQPGQCRSPLPLQSESAHRPACLPVCSCARPAEVRELSRNGGGNWIQPGVTAE